jgi:hypothetical protein
MTTSWTWWLSGWVTSGCPLAREATAARLNNPEVVFGLNSGPSHIDDLTDSDVNQTLQRGFAVTPDAHEVRRARTIVICVPTPPARDGFPELAQPIAASLERKSSAPSYAQHEWPWARWSEVSGRSHAAQQRAPDPQLDHPWS